MKRFGGNEKVKILLYMLFKTKKNYTTSASMVDSFNSSTDFWLLHDRLESLIKTTKESWTYAVFWQPTLENLSTSSSTILGWGDGYYNGSKDEVKKLKQNHPSSSASKQVYRKKLLRELNSLLFSHDEEVADFEEVTDTEWFFLVSITQRFCNGWGLPGQAFMSKSLIWVTGADRPHCERARQAQHFGLQTLVFIPLENGVVELGSTDLILKNLDLMNMARVFFNFSGRKLLDSMNTTRVLFKFDGGQLSLDCEDIDSGYNGSITNVNESGKKFLTESRLFNLDIGDPEFGDERVEQSPVEDVGCTMTTASQPSSFQTMKSLPQQEVEEETMVLDTSTQKLMLSEDVLQIQNKEIIVGVEKDDATIHFVSKTCIEDTSERENQSERYITFETITEHFGRSLNDAAKFFGVSRSKFKRICRDRGIQRWQYGKRRINSNVSLKFAKRLNDEESSKRNFTCPQISPVQNRTVVAHTSQDLNKMTVKATYNGVTIRFQLPGSSGFAELENNVIERLHLERKSFSIKYQDDEGDWVLIACDMDVQECLEISRSLNKTTIKMFLDQPVNHFAP